VLAVVGVSLLLTAAVAGLAYTFARAPDGPPLAAIDIQSGKPFELAVTSKGVPLRFWVDMKCDSCAFPVEGKLELSANGSVVESTEISAGDTRDRAWGGHSRTLEQHLILQADQRPAGELITAKGVLTVRGPRGAMGAPIEGAPAPMLGVFRLSVTN
jgi:hypothetical protein